MANYASRRVGNRRSVALADCGLRITDYGLAMRGSCGRVKMRVCRQKVRCVWEGAALHVACGRSVALLARRCGVSAGSMVQSSCGDEAEERSVGGPFG